jgi:hypothetical protein
MATLILVLALSLPFDSALACLAQDRQDPPRAGVAAWDTVAPGGDLTQRGAWKRLKAAPPLKATRSSPTARSWPSPGNRERGSRSTRFDPDADLSLPAFPTGAGALEKVVLAEVGRGGAVVELSWKNASVRFRIPKGELFVESQAITGDAPLRIDCPGAT